MKAKILSSFLCLLSILNFSSPVLHENYRENLNKENNFQLNYRGTLSEPPFEVLGLKDDRLFIDIKTPYTLSISSLLSDEEIDKIVWKLEIDNVLMEEHDSKLERSLSAIKEGENTLTITYDEYVKTIKIICYSFKFVDSIAGYINTTSNYSISCSLDNTKYRLNVISSDEAIFTSNLTSNTHSDLSSNININFKNVGCSYLVIALTDNDSNVIFRRSVEVNCIDEIVLFDEYNMFDNGDILYLEKNINKQFFIYLPKEISANDIHYSVSSYDCYVDVESALNKLYINIFSNSKTETELNIWIGKEKANRIRYTLNFQEYFYSYSSNIDLNRPFTISFGEKLDLSDLRLTIKNNDSISEINNITYKEVNNTTLGIKRSYLVVKTDDETFNIGILIRISLKDTSFIDLDQYTIYKTSFYSHLKEVELYKNLDYIGAYRSVYEIYNLFQSEYLRLSKGAINYLLEDEQFVEQYKNFILDNKIGSNFIKDIVIDINNIRSNSIITWSIVCTASLGLIFIIGLFFIGGRKGTYEEEEND